MEIRDAVKRSVGSAMPAKSLELKHTLKLIEELSGEIDEIEVEIKVIMDKMNPPILTIPGINYRMGLSSSPRLATSPVSIPPDKILAYAGLCPSVYQSGKLVNGYRGSRYLLYALFNATKFVCRWNPTFAAYLVKKRAEGKHYSVAISHAAKKLVRLIFAMQKSGKAYQST